MGNSGLSVNTPIDSVGYGANFYKAQVGATNTGFSRNIQIISGYNVLIVLVVRLALPLKA